MKRALENLMITELFLKDLPLLKERTSKEHELFERTRDRSKDIDKNS